MRVHYRRLRFGPAQAEPVQRQVPIIVRICEDARQDLPVVERLTVPGGRVAVMLGQLATLELTGGPVVTDRHASRAATRQKPLARPKLLSQPSPAQPSPA